MQSSDTYILGAGPAGLAAAYTLAKQGRQSVLIDRDKTVGGLSKSIEYQGFILDYGAHYLDTSNPQMGEIFDEILGDQQVIIRPIVQAYWQKRFYSHPPNPIEILRSLPISRTAKFLLGYTSSKIGKKSQPQNYGEVLTAKYGDSLFQDFFQPYLVKVWGISCASMSVESVSGRADNTVKIWLRSTIGKITNILRPNSYSFQFQYPIAGLGQFYQGIGEFLQRQDQQLLLETSVTALHHHNGLIQSITTRQGETTTEHPCKAVLSSIGLTLLLKQLDPPPPAEILAAAQTLAFRSIILAYLIIDGVDLFPAHSIYVTDAQVATTRITNYANWSPQMLPNKHQTPLCCERWCELGDKTWQKSDAEILAQAESELRQIGSLTTQQVASGFVVRLPNASPVYSTAYRAAKDQIEQYLQSFANLWTIGRGGSFSYSDQDRVMLMGVTAALESIEYLQKTGCSN